MSGEKPSYEFERAVLEASALLITLLFIMLQMGEIWKDPRQLAGISDLAFFFALAAALAVVNMGLAFGGLFTRVLRLGEIAFFAGGLFTLSSMFYLMAARVPEYGGDVQKGTVAVIVIMAIVSVLLPIIDRIPRRKPQERAQASSSAARQP